MTEMDATTAKISADLPARAGKSRPRHTAARVR